MDENTRALIHAALNSDITPEQAELKLHRNLSGVQPVTRPDCADCGRERTPTDDNHAPGCAFREVFGQGA